MRIAQVAPLFESVPPKSYGGTERVVHWLAEGLRRRGHEVTVFASGDSTVDAELVAMWPRSLRGSTDPVSPDALHAAGLQAALLRSPRFDVVHAHLDWVSVALSEGAPVPVLTTMHGRLDIPEIRAVVAAFPRAALASISHAQREYLPSARWAGTVHHGLPMEGRRFFPEAGNYFAFVGRISPEKCPDLAIRVARAAGLPLRIAAKIDGCNLDREYRRTVIDPLMAGGDVEFVGEIAESEKEEFMGRAAALLFPIDWPEPFGLVAIEAMSYGTPVITAPMGALPEIVEDGRTGFLCNGFTEMVAAARAVSTLDRRECRAAVVDRFLVERMVRDYEEIYVRLAREAQVELPGAWSLV